MMAQTILYGALSGGGIAIGGLLNARAKAQQTGTKENFDQHKFAITILIGAVVGAVGGYMGWDYNHAYVWLANMGGVALIEHYGKATWRHANMPKLPKENKKKKKKDEKKEEKTDDSENDKTNDSEE